MTKTEKIKAMADEVRVLTVLEASKLPGLWAKILPCILREVGYYAVTVDGKKVFFELAK